MIPKSAPGISCPQCTHIHTVHTCARTPRAPSPTAGEAAVTYRTWLCSRHPGSSQHLQWRGILETTLCGAFWGARSLTGYLDNMQSIDEAATKDEL